ncbi:uncharacterized protein LOC124342870 isoform X2 [Daphnia pulicaria]|nr:uncharacterized protein LOC124342870 isoform X2 [Daphnia pulicaria]
MAIKEKDPSTAQLHLNPATGNNCSICEKIQSLNSLWEAVDDSPEFVKCLEDLKANEHGELDAWLDAKTMTIELLGCHFLKRSEFEFRNCYGPMFESCRAHSLIKKHVQERFPDVADDQFDSDVKSWFNDQYSLFEELKFVSVVDDQEQAAECVTESGETVGMLISLIAKTIAGK